MTFLHRILNKIIKKPEIIYYTTTVNCWTSIEEKPVVLTREDIEYLHKLREKITVV